MNGKLILASTSEFRRSLLARLQLPFECVAPMVDEDSVKDGQFKPADLAVKLAQLKAERVARQHSDATVIGSDQVCSSDGQLFDKPGTQAAAREQLRKLSGACHALDTAVCVACGEMRIEYCVTTRLWMRELSDNEIDRYISREDSTQCAGSYRIESLGLTLFERIECEDFTAIVGLPLLRLAEILRSQGWQLP